MKLDAKSHEFWLPRCLQLFDSALPTGGYAHSFGLEGLVQTGEILDCRSLIEFLEREVCNSAIHCDLPVFREAYEQTCSGRFEGIAEIDELANALRPTFELRKAGSRTGRQTWRLYASVLSESTEEFNQYTLAGNFLEKFDVSVVTGILSAILGIPLQHAMTAYMRQMVSNFAQVCIKLLHFGPTKVQEISFAVNQKIPEWVNLSGAVHMDDAGSSNPRWDIASSNHFHSERRLYIS